MKFQIELKNKNQDYKDAVKRRLEELGWKMTKNKRTRIALLEKGYTLKTYNQWIKLGFGVNTGETSLCRNEYGQALFTDEQVTERGGK